MIGKERLAARLKELGKRPAGLSDAEHITSLRTSTKDETWVLYLDSFAQGLERGLSYGVAIADPMSLDLDSELQERLRRTKDSSAVDEMLLDSAFDLLRRVSDYDQFKSMLDRAGYRYSMHRDNSRGPGPYDIDVYTAMTGSHPDSELTGETANVSFSFGDNGALDGIRSYSMGQAPANPLRRGEEIPNYSGVKRRFGPRIAEPIWWLTLTTPTRDRFMAGTPKLAEFMQGWAMQANEVVLDFENRLEVRGRARPFRGVEIIEIGDGVHDALPVSSLSVQDFTCMRRLFSDRRVRWCLHPLVADTRQDVFEYNCFISLDYPTDADGVERAKATYARERSSV
jgi:hypothetical protein